MVAVILCGGQSTRMGDDKGLLRFENETWAELAYKKISALNKPHPPPALKLPPSLKQLRRTGRWAGRPLSEAERGEGRKPAHRLQTVLSINSNQFQDYSSIFLKDQLIPDNTSLNIAGPLLGIISVHCCFPGEDFLVLACDLPNMQSEVLEELLSQYKKDEGDEAIAFRFGEQIEPLCGIYTARGLAKILAAHKKNLDKHSMMYVLDTLQTRFLVPKESWGPFFKNMNSHSDLMD